MTSPAVCRGVSSLVGIVSKPFLKPTLTSRVQAAGIISKAFRDKDYKRPPPYPYKEKPYGLFQAIFDSTIWRLEENSKVIIVEGPIASGKADLAKKLAEELDMHYVPHSHLDAYYINFYGYNMRKLNSELPFKARSFDTEEFVMNPTDSRTALMQFRLFFIKLSDYIDALAHVLSTGQGVVMNRSVFSDFIFVETMAKFGFIGKHIHKYYREVWNMMKQELMRPQLVIYLDVPTDVIIQRLKKENADYVNSPFLQPKVLDHMSSLYKEEYLKDVSKHSEILFYDWSEYGDPEVVVEDTEMVDFDHYDLNSSKMADWNLGNDKWTWNVKRMWYTKKKPILMSWATGIPPLDCPELVMEGDELKRLEDVWLSAPGMKFIPGFNTDMGDVNIAFKNREDRVRM